MDSEDSKTEVEFIKLLPFLSCFFILTPPSIMLFFKIVGKVNQFQATNKIKNEFSDLHLLYIKGRPTSHRSTLFKTEKHDYIYINEIRRVSGLHQQLEPSCLAAA